PPRPRPPRAAATAPTVRDATPGAACAPGPATPATPARSGSPALHRDRGREGDRKAASHSGREVVEPRRGGGLALAADRRLHADLGSPRAIVQRPLERHAPPELGPIGGRVPARAPPVVDQAPVAPAARDESIRLEGRRPTAHPSHSAILEQIALRLVAESRIMGAVAPVAMVDDAQPRHV